MPNDQPPEPAAGPPEPGAELVPVTPVKVGLSTSSVYPDTTASAFELARRLGYDGVELMVGIDPVAADIGAVEQLRDYHGVPVLAIHAPCLLITQRVWGTDAWAKLDRSAEAAQRLGADVVVVHPPFRWQRDYARGFVDGIRRLTESTGVLFCVENMYPWRTPAGELKAYMPGWDPTELDYADLTLDLSHASTANQSSLDLARSWGDRLRHLHLTDGSGSRVDEHLVPGRGDQSAAAVLEHLAATRFSGHVVLEINSRKSSTPAHREADLVESLAFARHHLSVPTPVAAGTNSGGKPVS